MPIYDKKIVELTKIINTNPFNAIWHLWETDISFNIIGSESNIIIRTPDKLLSGCSASIINGTNSTPIELGSYNIGNSYSVICSTQGYINTVYKEDILTKREDQIQIPNIGEVSIEFIADVTDLVPFVDSKTNGGYDIGCEYNKLKRRY